MFNRLFSAIFVSFLLVFAVFPTISGAEDVTLSQALRELGSSPRIERAESMLEESSWKRVESYSGFLPMLHATASHLLDKKYLLTDVMLPGAASAVTIPQILNNTTYALSAEWTLFDGLTNVDRLRAAKAFERASVKELDWTRFQAKREVILAFYHAVAARTLEEVATQNLKTLGDHLNDVRLFKKSGVGTTYDVLRVEVQESEAQSERLGAADAIYASLLRLGDLVGEDYSDRGVSGKLPVLSEDVVKGFKEETLKEKEESGRADLLALQERVAGAEQLADSAAKFWVPRISAFGQVQEYNNRNGRLTGSDGFRNAYSVGVQLGWNLFDGMTSIAKDRQASERRVQSEKELEIARIHAKTDVEVSRRRFLYFCSIYRARSSDIDKASESVRLAKEGRRAGIRTNTDLLDAELELFRARAGVVKAQIGAIEALLALELASGREFYSFN